MGGKDRVGGGTAREFGTDMYTLLSLKWITNQDLLYSTGKSVQYYVTTQMERNLKKNGYMSLYN